MADYDLERLAELRDRHQQVLAEYRRASEAVREAAKSLSQMRVTADSVAMHPHAADAVPARPERAARLKQQVQTAEARLARLTAARDALLPAVKQSTAFNTRLEQFARGRNL